MKRTRRKRKLFAHCPFCWFESILSFARYFNFYLAHYIYVEYVLGRVTLLAEGCRGSLSEVCLTYLVILSQFQFFIFWIM